MSHGFSDLEDMKQELRNFLLIQKKEVETDIPLTIDSTEYVLSFLIELRLLSLSHDEKSQNFQNIIDLLSRINSEIVFRHWNNEKFILLLSILFNNIFPLLNLLNLHETTIKFFDNFLIHELTAIKKWNVNIENILSQTLPMLIFSKENINVYFSEIMKDCIKKSEGNKEIMNWLENLSLVPKEKPNFEHLINNPFHNDVIDYCIFWLHSNDISNHIFDVLIEKYENYKINIDTIVGNQNHAINIEKWICMEFLFKFLIIKSTNIYSNYNQILPFSKLSPSEFERLCYWIVYNNKSEWEDVIWLGASGGEKGKDIVATKVETKRKWIIQCKRVQQYGPSDFEKEFQKTYPEIQKYSAEGYITYLTRPVSDLLIESMKFKEKEKGVKIVIVPEAEIDIIVKKNNFIIQEFFPRK